METNPYAPPKAPVADWQPVQGLKKRRIVAMVLLMIVTFGVYYPIWFLRRHDGLNRLNSPRKLSLWAPIAFSLMLAALFVLGLLAAPLTPEEAFGPGVGLVILLVRLSVTIAMIVHCFKIKDILEDHLTPDGDGSRQLFVERVALSSLLTFFLQPFYLQYIINTHVLAPREQQV